MSIHTRSFYFSVFVFRLRRKKRSTSQKNTTTKRFVCDNLAITTESIMSALFNLTSLLQVVLLIICTSTYIHGLYPSLMDQRKTGVLGIFWKAARVGERLSPYVSLCLMFFAVTTIIS